MRLDGPDEPTVEKMLQTSIDVEKTGLQGLVAIDARGLPATDTQYGPMDQHLRHLAEIVRTKTQLKLAFDDTPDLFLPHSVKNTAVYVGWYSPGHYVPSCDFNPGAVGYHIASWELGSLHTPNTQWVRGLISDGVVGTLGPVYEPYLGAFPLPDEFVPLLLTGKLTLAEAYWRTTPMTSWMISFIGDPLYNPYKTDPALAPDDLPEYLKAALPQPAATQTSPSTQP
jgi:uncharacterized protein (TIGR03790 family)